MGKQQYERQKLEGKQIKKFNLVSKLGGGEFGTVYKAVNTKTDEILAIKVLSKKQMKQTPKLEQLVKSQIEILQQVKNANVIKFIDSFSSGDNIFIVTEFCNGGDLQKYCERQGRLPEVEAVNFLKQILNGFKGLHQINTMHRDFKLANVLIHNHVCKIADLGFAKQLKDKALTVTTLGTDETMAPEVHEGSKYGWGADIWSIGVVFYQMLYGRLPYNGLNSYTILRNIKTTKPNYDDVDVSQQAIEFIQKCLVYNVKQRISWKQIYDHPLLYKSDITLTTGLLRNSRINFQGHKTYYDRNEQEKRQTVKYGDDFDVFQTNNKYKDLFQNAGDIKNADKKADQIRENKQLLDAQFEKYQSLLIEKRNNRMFGITHVLPLQKQFSSISISFHSKALYEICKQSYIAIKRLRQQVCQQKTNQSYKGLKFWKQFKHDQMYKSYCDQLFDDEMLAESLTISYKHDLNENTNENMNRSTEVGQFRNIVEKYRKDLTPYLKKQPKKNKPKYIKMLKALKVMEQVNSWDAKLFDQQTQNMKVQSQEKYLLSIV